MPGLPKAIYPLLIPIEFLSNVIVRPFTHAVRLFANMFAGHLLLLVFILGGEHLLQGAAVEEGEAAAGEGDDAGLVFQRGG